MRITLHGHRDAQRALEAIQQGVAGLRGRTVEVGTRLPYGYGIEHGRHRKSGRVARRAGGALYLKRALREVLSDADRDISEGLRRVRRPGLWIFKRLGRWTRRLARLGVPRERGRLRRSIQVYVDGRRAR